MSEFSLQRSLIFATRPLRYGLSSLLYRARADKSKLLALKDSRRGETVLVVGNGPSLNSTPLDDFAAVPSIGMNKIDLIYPRTTWRPELVVCVNSIVAKQNQDAFAASDIPVFLAWKARSMLRSENRHRCHYFNLTSSNHFATNAIEGFGSSATVTYIALQMAYWMGAETVILVGVDHSFKFQGPKGSYQKRSGDDENHFDPNYFKAGTVWGTPDLDQSEVDYGLARQAFEAAGRQVLDATVGGQLQVFEKIDLDTARELARVPQKQP